MNTLDDRQIPRAASAYFLVPFAMSVGTTVYISLASELFRCRADPAVEAILFIGTATFIVLSVLFNFVRRVGDPSIDTSRTIIALLLSVSSVAALLLAFAAQNAACIGGTIVRNVQYFLTAAVVILNLVASLYISSRTFSGETHTYLHRIVFFYLSTAALFVLGNRYFFGFLTSFVPDFVLTYNMKLRECYFGVGLLITTVDVVRVYQRTAPNLSSLVSQWLVPAPRDSSTLWGATLHVASVIINLAFSLALYPIYFGRFVWVAIRTVGLEIIQSRALRWAAMFVICLAIQITLASYAPTFLNIVGEYLVTPAETLPLYFFAIMFVCGAIGLTFVYSGLLSGGLLANHRDMIPVIGPAMLGIFASSIVTRVLAWTLITLPGFSGVRTLGWFTLGMVVTLSSGMVWGGVESLYKATDGKTVDSRSARWRSVGTAIAIVCFAAGVGYLGIKFGMSSSTVSVKKPATLPFVPTPMSAQVPDIGPISAAPRRLGVIGSAPLRRSAGPASSRNANLLPIEQAIALARNMEGRWHLKRVADCRDRLLVQRNANQIGLFGSDGTGASSEIVSVSNGWLFAESSRNGPVYLRLSRDELTIRLGKLDNSASETRWVRCV